jgi:hypothetical protein
MIVNAGPGPVEQVGAINCESGNATYRAVTGQRSWWLEISGRIARGSRPAERPAARSNEEQRVGQAAQDGVRDQGVAAPEPRCLRLGQLEPRHLAKLGFGATHRGVDAFSELTMLRDAVDLCMVHVGLPVHP